MFGNDLSAVVFDDQGVAVRKGYLKRLFLRERNPLAGFDGAIEDFFPAPFLAYDNAHIAFCDQSDFLIR